MNRLSFEKVFYHLDHLADYIPRGDCYPVHMIVGLTNICNHSCIWCYGADTISSQYNENVLAPAEMIVSTVGQAAQLGLRAVTFVGTGEPTCHPKFVEIVRSIKAIGVDIGLFSNGSLIHGDKARAVLDTHTFIRVSCSAADMEEHNRIHHAGRPGNDFERIVRNIRFLLEKRARKPFPTIGVQFAISHQNWQSLLDACRLWKDVGVDYFSVKPVYKNENIMEHGENQAPVDKVIELAQAAEQLSDEKFQVYAKYAQIKRVLIEKGASRGYDKCHGQAFSTFLDPDGNLYICGNRHGQAEFSIGNVLETGSFEEVWNGQRRKNLLMNLDVKTCPVGCRMDPLNLLIEDLINPDPQIHPNFL